MSHENGIGPYGGVGGYLDDSVNEDQVELVLATLGRQADAASFVEWLRRELASFRNLRVIESCLPGVVQEQLYARRLATSVGELLRDLEEMPPTLADRLHAVLSRQGRDEVAGLTSKLAALELLLLRVVVDLRDIPRPRRGRKKDSLRDRLLGSVTDRLVSIGASKAKASAAAAEILVACGVKAPDGGRTRPDKRLGKN